jgi:DNA-binding SARP family transcriptional activator
MKIRRQYKEKLEVLENASKILKNLASVCPKVDALIELDEANTGLENKLFYSEFHVRKSPGYI